MSSWKAAILCLFAVSSLVSAEPDATISFKCYQCNSVETPECGDPFVPNNSTLKPTECQDLAYVAAIFFTNTFTEQRLKHACLKTVKTTGDKVVITRKCSLDTSEIKDSKGNSAPNMCAEDLKQTPDEFCSVCLTDACNSAPRTPFNPLLPSFAALILIRNIIW